MASVHMKHEQTRAESFFFDWWESMQQLSESDRNGTFQTVARLAAAKKKTDTLQMASNERE